MPTGIDKHQLDIGSLCDHFARPVRRRLIFTEYLFIQVIRFIVIHPTKIHAVEIVDGPRQVVVGGERTSVGEGGFGLSPPLGKRLCGGPRRKRQRPREVARLPKPTKIHTGAVRRHNLLLQHLHWVKMVMRIDCGKRSQVFPKNVDFLVTGLGHVGSPLRLAFVQACIRSRHRTGGNSGMTKGPSTYPAPLR